MAASSVRHVVYATAGAWLRHRPWVRSVAGFRLVVDPEDRRARALLLHRGTLDRPLVRVWRALIDHYRPDTVIDVGANYGEVALSRRYADGQQVLLFEPNPRVAECLRRSVAEAGVPSVHVHECALGRADGTADLNVRWAASGGSSIHLRKDGAHPLTVQVRALDSLLVGPATSLVGKIDVEGGEMDVLAGARATLEGAARWCLVIEATYLEADDLEALLADADCYAVWTHGTLSGPLPDAAAVLRVRTEPGVLKDIIVVPAGQEPGLRLEGGL